MIGAAPTGSVMPGFYDIFVARPKTLLNKAWGGR